MKGKSQPDDALRLIGLTGQSSILWAGVCFMALLAVQLLRQLTVRLSVQHARKENPMKKANKTTKVVFDASLNPERAIEAGSLAGVLSA
jgi:hypothetical protein